MPLLSAFPPRVVVTGAESTGKTTLAQQLAARLQTVHSPEMARHYLDAKGHLDARDVLPIAYAARAVELWLEPRAKEVLVCDTDVLSTMIYARELYGFESGELERLLSERAARVYLLLDTDIAWQADPTPGQRAGMAARARMAKIFEGELKARGLPFRVVSAQGIYDKRLEMALSFAREALVNE